jgi:hypothetical protein
LDVDLRRRAGIGGTAFADTGTVVRHVAARGPDAAVSVEADAFWGDQRSPDPDGSTGAVAGGSAGELIKVWGD